MSGEGNKTEEVSLQQIWNFPVLELTMKELLNNIRCPGGLRSLTVTRLQQDVARLLLLIVAACSQTFSAHNRSVLSHVYTYLDAYLCM